VEFTSKTSRIDAEPLEVAAVTNNRTVALSTMLEVIQLEDGRAGTDARVGRRERSKRMYVKLLLEACTTRDADPPSFVFGTEDDT